MVCNIWNVDGGLLSQPQLMTRVFVCYQEISIYLVSIFYLIHEEGCSSYPVTLLFRYLFALNQLHTKYFHPEPRLIVLYHFPDKSLLFHLIILHVILFQLILNGFTMSFTFTFSFFEYLICNAFAVIFSCNCSFFISSYSILMVEFRMQSDDIFI